MSERDARQFVVRVLDVAQGAGALLQVDDQPPRWLSADDSLAVDVPVQDEQVGRAMNLLRRVWDESGEGTGVVCRQTGANHWSDVVRWVSGSPAADEPGRPEPKRSGRDYRQVSRSEAGLTWSPRDNIDHSHASDLSAWSSYNHTRREFVDDAVEPEKADAPERWSGWSDEELDRLGQMLGDGGHELADLQAERRRRHAERQHCCTHDWDVIEYGGAPVALVCTDCGAKRKVVGE